MKTRYIDANDILRDNKHGFGQFVLVRGKDKYTIDTYPNGFISVKHWMHDGQLEYHVTVSRKTITLAGAADGKSLLLGMGYTVSTGKNMAWVYVPAGNWTKA